MKQADCYLLGEVIKTHGLKGEVGISLDVDIPEAYQNLESVFLLKNEKLIPFFIDSLHINSNKAIIKFEEVDSIEKANELVKCEIYLPLSFLPELPEDGYYFHDLVGMTVSEKGKALGIVKEVIDLNGNDLLSIQNEQTEILIPMNEEILKKVDLALKIIEVELPDGLLDIYQ